MEVRHARHAPALRYSEAAPRAIRGALYACGVAECREECALLPLCFAHHYSHAFFLLRRFFIFRLRQLCAPRRAAPSA